MKKYQLWATFLESNGPDVAMPLKYWSRRKAEAVAFQMNLSIGQSKYIYVYVVNNKTGNATESLNYV